MGRPRPARHIPLRYSHCSAVLLHRFYGSCRIGTAYQMHTPDQACLFAWQGVGAVGGHKEGLVPRAVALLHHLIQTSQHKGALSVTQSGENILCMWQKLLDLDKLHWQSCMCVSHISPLCPGMHLTAQSRLALSSSRFNNYIRPVPCGTCFVSAHFYGVNKCLNAGACWRLGLR